MNVRNLRYRGRLTTVAAGLSLATVLAACGGGSSTASSSPTTAAPAASGSGAPPSGGSFPGTVGSVASLSGSSMEVQNQQSGQVTVSWTPSTAFSQSASASAASVAVGDCVVVNGTSSNGSIAARTVSISQPSSSGTCTATRPAGGGFGRPGGGNAPSGSLPAGRTGPPPSFASGKVTSVAPGTLSVYGTSAAGGPASSGATASASNLTVALNSSTTYSKTQPAAATNLTVGDCVTATGTTDSTGAVTASSVRITSTGGQTCGTGFAGAGRGATNG